MSTAANDPMDYIWERLPKEKDGQTVRYLWGDIPYLYNNGFVDTRKFTYEQWKAAFEPFKQPDNSYVLTKKQFFSLRVFRYEKPVHEPFEPTRLKEGPWSDERLADLFKRAIKPSSLIPEEVFWNSVKALKKQGLVDADGNLMVDDKVKKQLAYLIERFPSPHRKLEKEVTRLRQEKDGKRLQNQKNRDASGFIIGKSEQEHKLESYQKLKASQAALQTGDDDDGDDDGGLDIKSMRRPRGKIRG